jgi:hypothetical protein
MKTVLRKFRGPLSLHIREHQERLKISKYREAETANLLVILRLREAHVRNTAHFVSLFITGYVSNCLHREAGVSSNHIHNYACIRHLTTTDAAAPCTTILTRHHNNTNHPRHNGCTITFGTSTRTKKMMFGVRCQTTSRGIAVCGNHHSCSLPAPLSSTMTKTPSHNF